MGNISCFFQSHNETKQELRMVKFWVTEQGSKLTSELGCPWDNHFSTFRRPR